jgi:hypothetical protein
MSLSARLAVHAGLVFASIMLINLRFGLSSVSSSARILFIKGINV